VRNKSKSGTPPEAEGPSVNGRSTSLFSLEEPETTRHLETIKAKKKSKKKKLRKVSGIDFHCCFYDVDSRIIIKSGETS